MALLSETAQAEIRALTERYPAGRQKSAVMPALYVAQREHGHLTGELLTEIAELLCLPPAHVAAILTFYSMYEQQPHGQHVIDVCTCLSCQLCGGYDILAHLEQRLGIKAGETTPDGKLTLREQECIGACANAPALQVDSRFRENLTAESVDALIDELLAEEVGSHG